MHEKSVSVDHNDDNGCERKLTGNFLLGTLEEELPTFAELGAHKSYRYVTS